jgi:tetraacyldisaccharide 4'-kinase
MAARRLSDWLMAQWPHRTWASRALWPLHLIMSALVALRRTAYARGWARVSTLPVPVLVVGNLIVGGAGKTPTVIAILAHLQARGHRPGLLTRGHGRQSTEPTVLLDQASAPSLNAQKVGDEPWLIWRRTRVPTAIDARRARGGLALLARHPEIDILVCDDGLQHLALARDIEVVVFDERGQGNGWLLPAGPLREALQAPSPSATSGQPLVLYNAPVPSTPLPGFVARKTLLAPQPWQAWCEGRTPHVEHLAALRQTSPEQVWAVAGIAQPERFFEGLRAMGLAFTPCPLADHASFATLPWPADVTHVLMTEKDAVKIDLEQVQKHRPKTQVWVAALDFSPGEEFWRALDARLPSPHR